MGKTRPMSFTVRAKRRVSQQHKCLCGRTLHNHHDWNSHKERCAEWAKVKEKQQ